VKYVLPFAILLASCLTLGYTAPVDTNLVADPSVDDDASAQDTCEVYAAIITSQYAADTFVIATDLGTFPCGANDSQGKPGLPFPFDGKGSYVLLSDREAKDIFKRSRDGWTEFAKRYPTSNGIINLGTVNVNSDASQAVASAGYQCSLQCGSGSTFTLHKVNGRWFVFSKDDGYIL
jgi:hypothetical protein